MGKSKISNIEWGLAIGALFVIDLIQIGLDLLAIGIAINPFIDIFIGMSVWFYLYVRGENMTGTKQLISLGITFLVEEIPGADALPLWGVYGLYQMFLSKAAAKVNQAIVAKVPGGQVAVGIANKKIGLALVNREIRNESANLIGEMKSGRKEGETKDGRKISPDNMEQKDQSAQNQSASLDREINKIKKDIEEQKREIPRLEHQSSELKPRYLSHYNFSMGIIEDAKKNGASKEKMDSLWKAHHEGLSSMSQKISELSTIIHNRKNNLFALNNKLIELERKQGAQRKAA